jgi:hypothetical protein
MLVMVRLRQLGCGVMSMLRHAGGCVIEVTWPQRDVDVELCWGRCCQVMLAIALQLKVVLAVVRLHSPWA